MPIDVCLMIHTGLVCSLPGNAAPPHIPSVVGCFQSLSRRRLNGASTTTNNNSNLANRG